MSYVIIRNIILIIIIVLSISGIILLAFNNKSKFRISTPKFRIYTPQFNDDSGGVMVLHVLCKKILSSGYECKIINMNDTPINSVNNTYKQYYTNKNDTENCIVIYPEIISGNPLNAKKIIRWILCDLGKHCDKNIYKTWNKKDIIYFFGTFNPKITVSKYLFCFEFDKSIKKINNNERTKDCYEIRKAHKFHNNLKFIHPNDSYEIKNLSLKDTIDVFNKHRYYYCYDPYTFNMVIASLCGCIPIVIKIENTTKKDWAKSLYCGQYLIENKKDSLYGIAYGKEEIEYAINTNNMVSKEQDNIIKYGDKTIFNMINDIKKDNLHYVEDYYN